MAAGRRRRILRRCSCWRQQRRHGAGILELVPLARTEVPAGRRGQLPSAEELAEAVRVGLRASRATCGSALSAALLASVRRLRCLLLPLLTSVTSAGQLTAGCADAQLHYSCTETSSTPRLPERARRRVYLTSRRRHRGSKKKFFPTDSCERYSDLCIVCRWAMRRLRSVPSPKGRSSPVDRPAIP